MVPECGLFLIVWSSELVWSVFNVNLSVTFFCNDSVLKQFVNLSVAQFL
jgi:hypothetical protein